MNQRLASVLIIVLLLLTNDVQAEQRKFKLGIIGPLSGPLAEYGTAVVNGFELARRAKPELFANLDLVFEDDQYDGKKSISAFHKLREVDGVDLVYLWGSGPAQAVAPIAETRKVPLVVMAIDPSSALGRSWVIRFANYSEQYVLKLLEFLRENSIKSIGMLRTELDYTNSMANALRANLQPDETLTEVAVLQPGDSDLNVAIARLSNQQFDAVAVYLMTGQIAQFYRKAANRFSSRVTFGTDFFESTTEAKSAGPGMVGAVFPNNAVEDWFEKRYRDEFGNDSQITFAANAYDFAMLVADTFGKSENGLNADGIRDRLRGVSPRKGASGEYAFRESDKGGQYFEFPIVIRQIEKEGIATVAQNNALQRTSGSAGRR